MRRIKHFPLYLAAGPTLLTPALHAAPSTTGGKGPMMLIFPGIAVLVIIVLILVTRRR